MLAQGADLYVVSQVLRHSSVAITKDVYGHLVEGPKRAAAARMSEALLTSDGSRNGSRAHLHRAKMLAEPKKEGLTRQHAGAPGGIRIPDLLIRRSIRRVRDGPKRSRRGNEQAWSRA
jgi:hypothetical protein